MVNSSLSYVPELYPDETFYSFFARYRRDLRLGQEPACRDFFGTFKFVSPCGMQGGLDQLAKRIHPGRGLTAERLVRDTTPYNYYAAFADHKRAQNALRELTEDGGRHAPKILSMRQSPLGPPAYLQLCLECCQDAQERYRDLYWRRAHQLPGVSICPVHDTILLRSPVGATGNPAFFKSVALSESVIEQSSPVHSSVRFEAFQLLAKISKDSSENCTNTPDPFNQSESTAFYRYILRTLGLGTANIIDSSDVLDFFLKYLNPVLLFIPKLRSDSRVPLDLKSLWTSVPRSVHPLLHILFRNFIADFSSHSARTSDDVHDFGSAPWPCLNPLAEHSGELKVNRLVLHEYGHGRDNKASFRCPDCSYTYRRTAGTESIEIMDLGDDFDKRLKDLVAARVSLRKMETTLHVSTDRLRSAAKRLGLKLPSKMPDYRKPLAQAQADFEKMIETYPSASRTELRSHNQRLYKRLRAQCPMWLYSKLPFPEKSGNWREWSRLDKDLVCIIEERGRKRLSAMPPKRVTKRYLLRTEGWHRRAEQHKLQLPLSWALLEKTVETLEEFYERSLTWAAVKLTGQGLPLTKTALRRLTGAAPTANPIAERVIEAFSRSPGRYLSKRALTDEQWEGIQGLLPGGGETPRPGTDNRLFVDAILWMAGNAAQWRDLPTEFGKWTGVYARFRAWSHRGVWERLFYTMADKPDFEYVLIDSTITKIHADAMGEKGGLKLPR